MDNLDTEELVINPFISIGSKYCCRECGGTFYVCDTEMTCMELSDRGIPITEDTTMKCKGICLKCGKKVDMFRWQGKYLPYYKSLYNDLVARKNYEIKKRVESLNASYDPKNPFVITKEEASRE